MNIISGMDIEEIVCIGMSYGDDFHECVERAVNKKKIDSGVILSAVATFYSARIHYITHTQFPAEDKFVELEGPIELCSVSGIIAERKPHMHCTMAVRGGELFAGHLEPGCKILYLGEVAIAKLRGKILMRERHQENGTPYLIEKTKE